MSNQSFKDLVKQASGGTFTFTVNGTEFKGAALTFNDFTEIDSEFGVNLMSQDPDSNRLTPEIIRYMLYLSLRRSYDDVTPEDAGELLSTTFINSDEFQRVIAKLQGASDEEVEEQVQRFREEQQTE